MNNHYLSKLKRTMSGILALAMTASLTSVMPAAADTPIELVSRTYSGDGYEVRYDVTGGWADNRNVQVTLTNTGDEPLQNWALKYDVQGEIVNIWNGTVAASGDDWSIVKNNGYNYDIQPKASTSFGYIVQGSDIDIPATIELCTERKEVAEDNYTVKLNVDSDWGSGFTGSFSIENLGDTPIEAWRLSFDNNFVIENTWNANIYSSEENSYTVANAYATAFINPHEAVSFGFRGTKDNDVVPEIGSISLSAITINSDIKTDVTISDSSESSSENSSSESSSENTDSDSSDDSSVTDSSSTSDNSSSVPDSQPDDSSETESKPDESSIPDEEPKDELSDELSIFAYGHYNKEEKAIDIDWYTETKGEYTVLESDDNVDYSEVITVSDFSDYRYHITEPFDTKYFKVKVTSSRKYAESVPFEVKRTADGYDVAFIDTDGDGIADAREDELGTDKNKADTDDDGVSDYDELCLTNSDPLIYDSITEGISDKYADTDNDGLTNYEELKIGTYPFVADSDDDGLNDGDEVNKYGTDPLNKDTDNDGVSDYDEVTFGLDPLKASSDGDVPDSKKTFKQKVGQDAEAFADINTGTNPYKVSMDITASGIAYDNLDTMESGYSSAIQSDAIFGAVPNFTYTDGLSVEKAVINFAVEPDFVENTDTTYSAITNDFDGIKRFNVFKYIESADMLVPIKTEYSDNTVKAEVDELGTYCLIDMSKWLKSLDIEPERLESVTLSPSPVGMLGIKVNSYLMASAAGLSSTNSNRQVDVVFGVFLNRTSNKARIKEQIDEAGRLLFEEYGDNGNVHIYVTDCYGHIKTKIDDAYYATNSYELDIISSDIGVNTSTNISHLSNAVNNFFDNFDLRSDSSKFYVSVQSAEAECTANERNDILKRFLEQKVNLSIITNLDENRILADSTGGYFGLRKVFTFGEPLANHIINFNKLDDEGKVYRTVSANGLKTIALEEDITKDYVEVLERGVTDADRVKYADQDRDGLLNLEEIRYDYAGVKNIKWDSERKAELLTIKECMELPIIKEYTEGAFEQYEDFDISLLNDCKVLPIWSDPTIGDSDYDKIVDGVEVDEQVGTDPLSKDTDNDRLNDYQELINWFDPLHTDVDNDNYDDYKEWLFGTNPYEYDLSFEEKTAKFLKGFALGDFDVPDTVDELIGQLAGSLVPFVADGRDFFANVFKHGDTKAALMNEFGLLMDLLGVGVLADAAKVMPKVSNFVIKHCDEVGKVLEAVVRSCKEFFAKSEIASFLARKLPDSVVDKLFGAVKDGHKVSKKEFDCLTEICEVAGKNIDNLQPDELIKAQKVLSKTADIADDCLDIARKYGDEVADVIKKLPADNIDNIRSLVIRNEDGIKNLIEGAKDSETLAKRLDLVGKFDNSALVAINKYGDETLEALEKCSNDKTVKAAISLINNEESGEITLKVINVHGDKAVEAISNVSISNTKGCANYIQKFGKDSCEAFSGFGDDAFYALDHCSEANRAAAIQMINEDGLDVAKIIEDEGDNAIDILLDEPQGSRSAKAKEMLSAKCFIAGTLIKTVNGLKPIEEVQIGDSVYAKDENRDIIAVKKVTNTFVNETNELIHIKVNSELISSTPNHPFYVDKLGWTLAKSLRAGDVLVQSNGEFVIVEWVQHEILETPVNVYNFEVDDFHTYFVGKNSILAHNACKEDYYKTWNQFQKENKGKYTKEGMSEAWEEYKLAHPELYTKNPSEASSAKLRRNLINSTEHGMLEPEYNNAAHHIVAGEAEGAEEARGILKNYKININDAINGVFLPTEKGASQAAYHQTLHTTQYYEKVTRLLKRAQSKDDVIVILKHIRTQLLNGTFI